MSDEIDIVIRDYGESMAEDVAQMWNTWDDLWPGGFTQGVPYTTERVKKQFGKSNALAILIAIDQNDKKPVGSCTLYAHWRDKEAAYIGTLGVSHEALGKKVGKRLLLESIQRALEKGYSRVDLNTWAGNMKAVPLYKKIGMMWNPEMGGVQMEDYIPGILKHPLCSPFFIPLSGNGDWYDAHVREPAQAPDDNERKGMAVFPYEFKHNENTLSVTIDRLGRGITAIERVINDVKIRVDASVNSHQVLCGLPYTYQLEIENGSESDIDASIALTGFSGLVFDEDSSKSTKIKPGEILIWDVPFHLDSSAALFRDNVKASNIITNINIDGQDSELHTGLKVKPAAEIRTRWGECRIVAGGPSVIPLTIISNIPKSVKAKILLRDIDVPLNIKNVDDAVTIDAEGLAGIILNISSSEDLEEGAHDLWVRFEITPKSGKTILTREYRVPIFCLGKKGIAVGHDDRQRRIVIASSDYNATFSEEGAILRTTDQYGTDSVSFNVRSSIGPPFGIDPFRYAERDPVIQSTETETVVAMKANHPDRPLAIEDRAIFRHNSKIILHEVWVTNTSSESETFQLRLNGRGGGISFSRGSIYIPYAGGIVKENLGNFYFGHPVISGNPSDFNEGWVAMEHNSKFVGQFFDMSLAEEYKLGMGQMSEITFPLVTLDSGETRRLSQLWLVHGAQDWTDIQRLWKVHIGRRFEDRIEASKEQNIRNLINLDIDPIVLPNISEAEAIVSLTKTTLAPFMGHLSALAPAGWAARIDLGETEVKDLKDGEVASCEIQMMQDISLSLKLHPSKQIPDRFSIHRGIVNFETDWDVSKKFLLIQLGTSKNTVEITEEKDQGSKVVRVNNGLIDFTVSPDFGGCLISLRNQNGVEFMTSAFPNPAPKPGGFLDNYHGGIQPIIFDEEMGEYLMNAHTNKEAMTSSIYEKGSWKGVEINWIGKVQKLSRGMHFKLRYLTTPGSPIVLMQWVISNKTTAPIRFWPSLFIDPKLDEHLEGFRIISEWNGETRKVRKGMAPVAVTPSRNMVWIKPGIEQDSTSGFSLMMAGDTSRIISANLGENLLLGAVDGHTWILPGEERMLTGSILVDPINMEDIRDLQAVLQNLV